MPSKPPRPCAHPGCSELVPKGKCKTHTKKKYTKEQDKARGSSSARGYDRRWEAARIPFLAENPYCIKCGSPANVVDHIIPHRGDVGLFWNIANWQPMCKPCHDRKTAAGG